MASVDDYEELIAIRKLNGLDDDLYKKSDKNVASEEIDLTTVYMKGYADAEEKYRQKVKDKIKEIKRLRDRTITSEGFNILNGEVIVLQELLEENK